MEKLKGKDFIVLGSLTALMLIIYMVVGGVMSLLGFVTNVFYPAVAAIPNGIVMMLLLAKVPKRGVLSISAFIQGVLFLLMGTFWFVPLLIIIGGVICDFFIFSRNKVSMKSMLASYTVFSGFFTFGAIGPMRFMQEAYMTLCARNGVPQEYINGLIKMTSNYMLIVIVISGIVGGFIGGILGQRVLKKHFIKSGLVSNQNYSL